MSNACDPRNRPGFVQGDPVPYLPEPAGVTEVADDLRLVLLAAFSTMLIVAAVFGIVLVAA